MTHGKYIMDGDTKSPSAISLKDQYVVIADGFIKHRGNFRSCAKWCQDIYWAHDAFKELIITKVVANGKEV